MTAAGWRGPARGLNGGRDGGGERLGDAWQLLSDNSIPRGSHATEVSRKGCARRTSKGYAEASDDASLSHNRGFWYLSVPVMLYKQLLFRYQPTGRARQ
jgi:hypothetical protein